ncbi:MAG: hypothetical protein WCV93_05845 [Candidatus Shapirobacteria bacterium]|jgi:hypothetical protein
MAESFKWEKFNITMATKDELSGLKWWTRRGRVPKDGGSDNLTGGTAEVATIIRQRGQVARISGTGEGANTYLAAQVVLARLKHHEWTGVSYRMGSVDEEGGIKRRVAYLRLNLD